MVPSRTLLKNISITSTSVKMSSGNFRELKEYLQALPESLPAASCLILVFELELKKC
jgi:hypothetical protein